ncbi:MULTISPECIES: hypothetical protein [unclassified Chelatococcus]|uniref:hypothetical protein n=1 Tax=unclassified Chelatococcus TaxID=2638111 RepID=UPI001BD092CF|nr:MULTISPECIES: hypothetical protein [unclassified Chelatococcus]MBS7696099.1 hypothetical protein [Chelatococcus sp. YT9]MBX3558082.1 hypothetical protein [Chelatococcus sp.]
MIGLLRQFAAGAVAPIQEAARRTIIDIVLLVLVGVLVVIAFIFGAISATHWLSLHYGYILATAIMAGAFLVAAIVVLGLRILLNRRSRAPARGALSQGIRVGAAAEVGLTGASQSRPRGGLTPEELALLGTQDIVKSLSPFQLTLVAALAGFVGGRLLDKRK